MINLIKMILIPSFLYTLSSCSDDFSMIESEHIILACNAGQETDKNKCKKAEKILAENLEKLMNHFIK